MKNEKWHPVHWVILAMGLGMIPLMIQFNYIMDHCKPVNKSNHDLKKQDTLMIKQPD